MLSFKSFARTILLFLTALFLSVPGQSHAATYNMDNGQLIGAFDVNVEGTSYDVVFGDGTCIDLFTGCDEPSDFPFNESTAILASTALIEQVFNNGDNFDLFPELTRGCTYPLNCLVFTPYAISTSFPNSVLIKYALNASGSATDSIGNSSDLVYFDEVDHINATYAQWSIVSPSAVPVPAAVWLFGTALIGFVGISRRRKVA